MSKIPSRKIDKTFIVAINGQNKCPNISILPAVMYHGTTKFIIHYDPQIDFSSMSSNFDILFDFNIEGLVSKFNILANKGIAFTNYGINYIPIVRESKITQHLLINNAIGNLDGLNSNWITIPLFNSIKEDYIEFVSANLNSFGNDVVVKIDNGARGLGQAIVPTYQLNSFLDICKKVDTNSELVRYFPDVKFANNSDTNDRNLFKTYELIITPFINNITNEYRLLKNSAGMFIGYERNIISTNGYKQANLNDAQPIEGKLDLVKIAELLPKEIVSELNTIVDSVGFKFGSIDLFKTADDQYGIFEYSPQFGMTQLNHAVMTEFHVSHIIAECLRVNSIPITMTIERN